MVTTRKTAHATPATPAAQAADTLQHEAAALKATVKKKAGKAAEAVK